MVQQKIADPANALRAMEVDILAPAMRLGFATDTEHGESTGGARSRLMALFYTAVTKLSEAEQAFTGGGHARKTDTAYLRAWGRWFYENRIAQPPRSISTIAAENGSALDHPVRFEDHDCRKQVCDGIREVERLLEIGAYVFRHHRPPGDR